MEKIGNTNKHVAKVAHRSAVVCNFDYGRRGLTADVTGWYRLAYRVNTP